MTFCQKCGVKNEEDAVYCKGCGVSMLPSVPAQPSDWEPRMRMRRRSFTGWSIFWGLIVIVFGLWVAIEFGLKHIDGVPEWITSMEFCWVLPVIIGFLIILAGIRMLVNWD
ncbi:MAG: hypothetical protein V1934_00680 [Methanobacteriota archaeon]